MNLKKVAATATAAIALAFGSTAAIAGHYYGVDPDPPVDHINGTLVGNGSVFGLLPGGASQPNENHDFVVFSANAGDIVSVFLRGPGRDPGLSILSDLDGGGIHLGDALGLNIGLLLIDDDSGGGLDSLITFTAAYTGQYLAGIAEIGGAEMSWELEVRGSTAQGGNAPEPGALALMGLGLGGLAFARRRKQQV